MVYSSEVSILQENVDPLKVQTDLYFTDYVHTKHVLKS